MFKTVENKKIDEKYYYFKHESGLDIYIVPKNHTSSYAMFATKYGSVDNIFRLEGEREFTRAPGLPFYFSFIWRRGIRNMKTRLIYRKN